jgi:predicted nucleic acid-binding protein
MDAFVLDCSVTMAWCFVDEATRKTDDLLDSLTGARRAYTPSIWPLEVANVVLVSERKARISQKDAARFLVLLWELPVTIDQEMTPLIIQSILKLGRTHQISSYDAAYLELALRRDLAMATLDKRLKKVAKSLGVPSLL